MLVSITEKCRMHCIHCMDDAKESGNDMTLDTFKQVVKFHTKINDLSFTITGGEPIDHPMFWDFLEYAIKKTMKNTIFVITSNGMKMSEDEDGSQYEKFLRIKELSKKTNKQVLFQISSVPGLYPTIIDTSKPFFQDDVVTVDHELPGMYPQGRAVENGLEPKNVKISKCFNIRSVTRSLKSITKGIEELRLRGKFCTPSVTYEGNLHAGESILCPSIGATVWDDLDTVTEKMMNFRCDKCGLIKYQPLQYRIAVGELTKEEETGMEYMKLLGFES